MWWSFKPYVSAAERRANTAKEIKRLEKKGQKILPVHLEGKTIARTFWGKAWCDNLESYSDFENRLPRGRTYVRNGSVCDLQIEPGLVTAMVCGSSLYKIKIAIQPVELKLWSAIKEECAGQIGSLIELLQGKLSQSVMQIITRPGSGLFPQPAQIELDCSCPDWADMCKHVAAALYGVGARLDEHPELLFVLRKVDHLELIGHAGDINTMIKGKRAHKTIAADALSDVFGIELDTPASRGLTESAPPPGKQRTQKSKPATAKPTATAMRGTKLGTKGAAKDAVKADENNRARRRRKSPVNASPGKSTRSLKRRHAMPSAS